MATIPVTKTLVLPNRTQDYIYDANYTVAGKNDHQREMMKATDKHIVYLLL
jgi:hypothetical protein